MIALCCLATAVSGDEQVRNAWSLLNAGDFKAAQSAFGGLFHESPDNPEVMFGLGLASLHNGHFSRAAFMLNRLLDAVPAHHRARLELARAYLGLGLHALARKEFEQVLQSEPPDAVRRNIEVFLDQIRHEERRWDLGFDLVVSGIHDDNANLGPSSQQIDTLIGPLRVADDSTPVSTWGTAVGAQVRGTLDAGRLRHWMVTGSGSFYGNQLEDAPEQEILHTRVHLGLRHVRGDMSLDLPLKTDYLEEGGESLFVMTGIEPSCVWMPDPAWQLALFGLAEYRDHRQDPGQSGPYYRVLPSVRRALGRDPRDAVTLSTGGFFADADRRAERNHGLEASLLAEVGLPLRLTLFGLGSLRWVRFKDKQYTILQSEIREDEQWLFAGGLRHQLGSRFTVDANCRHVRNNSSFELYEYHRNIFTLSMSMRF